MRTYQIWILGVALAGLVVGCGGGEEAESGSTASSSGCKIDGDCSSGKLCLDGVCVAGAGTGGDVDGPNGTDNTDNTDNTDSTDSTDTTGEPTDNTDTTGQPTDSTDATDVTEPVLPPSSGDPCDPTNPGSCPDGEYCCDVGVGGAGYCAASFAACYGPGCETQGDCGEGRDCCEGQAGIPSYCAPKGGCYGPTCAGDGECGDGKTCCEVAIPLVSGICGPTGQCIGGSCTADSDCDPGVACCSLEIAGFPITLCLIGGLCELAKNAAGGGTDPDPDPDPTPAGCETSEDCNLAVCCKQEDGTKACQTVCECEEGTDCVDLGCCVSSAGAFCAPESLCFNGEWDPAEDDENDKDDEG